VILSAEGLLGLDGGASLLASVEDLVLDASAKNEDLRSQAAFDPRE
jgi:hypothetical protein